MPPTDVRDLELHAASGVDVRGHVRPCRLPGAHFAGAACGIDCADRPKATMISSPSAIPIENFSHRRRTSSQASGAPSSPCIGAAGRVFRREWIIPIGPEPHVPHSRGPDLAAILLRALTGNECGHAEDAAGYRMRTPGWGVRLLPSARLVAGVRAPSPANHDLS